MTDKEQKKEQKREALRQELEEFIAEHEMKNPHYLHNEEIIKAFAHVKPKRVKKVLADLR